jgi:hypothetical protein
LIALPTQPQLFWSIEMNGFAAAAACAERATTWLSSRAALERNAPPGTDFARHCHLVRNRLGSLQAALDVAAISVPGGEGEREARAIAIRQAAELAALLQDVQEVPWAAR